MPNLTLYEQLEKSHRKTLREIAGDSDSWKRFTSGRATAR